MILFPEDLIHSLSLDMAAHETVSRKRGAKERVIRSIERFEVAIEFHVLFLACLSFVVAPTAWKWYIPRNPTHKEDLKEGELRGPEFFVSVEATVEFYVVSDFFVFKEQIRTECCSFTGYCHLGD